MSSLAIILARAGSKRIPRKNIKAFCGKPLLSYSVEQALKSECFQEVMVSTDSQEIADIASSAGASVPFLRSPEASDDFATTMDALKDVIRCYKMNGKEFDTFCCIYPAAVLIESEDFHNSKIIFSESNADFLTTVVPFEYPIQRALKVKPDGKVEMIDKGSFNKRSQDLEKFFHDAGQFYWGRVDSLSKFNSFWEGSVAHYLLDPLKAQDIDTLSDWQIAELKFKYKLQARIGE